MSPDARAHCHRRPAGPVRAALVAALAALTASPALAQTDPPRVGSVLTEAGPIAVQNLADGLSYPWGMAFLPDGRLLVTERAGRLRILGTDHVLSGPVAGVPNVFAEGQGGLLDVALHPDFATNGMVYLSFARPGPEGSAATALGRGRFEGDSIAGFETLFTEEPWIVGPNHFGGRIVFDREGHVYLTLGERFQFEPAQDLSSHLGAIVRLDDDGSIPPDNPFVGQPDALGAIWSYGHRNIESAALDPATGELYVAEMGPLGGDELNRPERGRNYGWPVVSWGIHYDGEDIPDPPTRPEFADAVKHWNPVISPSGMAAYGADVFEAWDGSLLIGSLTRHGLMRIVLEDGQVTHEEYVPLDARIRDVETGPDGMVWVLTDQADGNVWRLVPLR